MCIILIYPQHTSFMNMQGIFSPQNFPHSYAMGWLTLVFTVSTGSWLPDCHFYPFLALCKLAFSYVRFVT